MLPVPRDRVPFLPALAVAALLAGLAAQALIPARTPLPEVGPSRAPPLRRADAVALPALPRPIIAARTVFAPTRRIDPAAAAATPGVAGLVPVDPFAGATLVGTAQARGVSLAVVRLVVGRVQTLGPGQRIGAWRVLGVTRDGAIFANGATRRRLGVGETAVVQSAPPQNTPEVDQ